MKYCNKCGTKVSADSKFCQDCGAILIVDSSNSPIITNLKVSLTNETNEKILSSVNGAVSSTVTALVNLIPKIIKLVIIILMIGVIGVVIHEIQQEMDRKTEEAYWKSKEAEVRKEMAFEAQKAFGTYHISTITKNGTLFSYSSARSPGRVTITKDKMVVHIDWNRDTHLSNKEKTTFKVKRISKSSKPGVYSRVLFETVGILETDIDNNIKFIIKSILIESLYRHLGKNRYRLLYKIGEDHYQLLLDKI